MVRQDSDHCLLHYGPRLGNSPVHYWMISSARTSSDWGMANPRALALLRLMTSSNFLGCSRGSSPGLVPLKNLVHVSGSVPVLTLELPEVWVAKVGEAG